MGQDHEVELRRKEGKYYLVNAAAGFAWCTYPFMGKFAETIGQWRLDYTIRLDILDGLDPAQKWPRLVGYIRMEPDRQLRRWTGKMKDTTKAPGADVDLYLFSDDPTPLLKARVRVAAAAEIILVDHGDAEYEED